MKWLNVKEMKKNEIQAVYSIFPLTHTNILKNLEVKAADQQEDKVSR